MKVEQTTETAAEGRKRKTSREEPVSPQEGDVSSASKGGRAVAFLTAPLQEQHRTSHLREPPNAHAAVNKNRSKSRSLWQRELRRLLL